MTPSPKEDRPIAALLAPDLLALLDEDPHSVAVETEEMHPRDLADVAEALPPEKVPELLAALPPGRAADVIEYLDEELRTFVLEAMTARQAATIVSAMTPDDRADVLEELEEEHADEILAEIPAEERRITEQLLAYEPDTAGGLMTTEFVSVPETTTAGEALRQVRAAARSGRREAIYAIYTTDRTGRLTGVLSLRELLAASDETPVSELAWEEVVQVPATADREEVAKMTQEYDLVALPVVDDAGRLLGVVTVDDVIDAIQEENTEDVQKLGAVEPLEVPYFSAGFWEIARKRGGWLLVLFFAEMLTITVLHSFEDKLAMVIALVAFIPLITSSGGNSGSQSATLITRALAVGDVELRDALRVVLREVGQGAMLGSFLGAIGFGAATLLGNPPSVALVVAVTLLSVVIVGTIIGALLPLLFTRVGVDPAIASSPFVASLVDVSGILLYVTIAAALLGL
jgi:magnesium transporter